MKIAHWKLLSIMLIAAITFGAVGISIAQEGTAEPTQEEKKVTVCHAPPGNPENKETISVGEPAVDAHLAHGDTLGECPAAEAEAEVPGAVATEEPVTEGHPAPSTGSSDEDVENEDLIPLRLQLKWVTQAQFAGYYAALNEGYYADEGLGVIILSGGPDISPQQVVAAGEAEFGVDWMGSHLASREAGSGAVVIAQIFGRSGMREIAWSDSGIESIADLEGRKVGVWGFGNQFPLFAALVKEGLDPEDPNDVEIINQPFDMTLLLNREVDAAAAMTYNEMAQVLEFVGEDDEFPVYTMEDLNVIDLNEVGTAMLEDNIFANEDWLAEEGNEELAIAFLKASLRGWAFCRDNPETCVEYVLESGSTLGAGHQTWMMNEINKLVWPSTLPVGVMDEALFQQTADIALNYEVISEAPDEGAWRNDLVEAAVAELMEEYPELDLLGTDWVAAEVEITPNGE